MKDVVPRISDSRQQSIDESLSDGVELDKPPNLPSFGESARQQKEEYDIYAGTQEI
jgi:hypothetical protein